VGGDRLMWAGTAAAGSIWARRALERSIRSTYPQLGPVRFEHFWPAHTGFAVHRMPQIGEVERGVWLASAFGWHGLNTSAMAGDLIARAIAERDDTWKRFLPFELVWAGGRTGRAVAGAAAWWQRQRDAALALAARQREELRRRRAEKNKDGAAGGRLSEKAKTRSQTSNRPARLAGTLPPIETLFGPGYKAAGAAKRRLKGSFAPDDRPIDAPEAVPAAGGGRSTEEAKRDPAPHGS
jgi:hypothetical protein